MYFQIIIAQLLMEVKEIEIQYGKLDDSDQDYRNDCLHLSPTERLASVQKLRVSMWGNEAATGRVQRVPDYIIGTDIEDQPLF